MERYKNYIGGEWVDPVGGEYFEDRNPADTRELIGLFPRSSREDVDKAVVAAREAYKKWRLVPPPKRAEILYRVAQRLVELKETIARDMTRENGKILEETRGDVQEAIDMGFFIAGEGRRLHGYTTTSELPDKMAFCIRVPVGVAVVITAWNFPMAVPSWKIFPALVCGNTVIFKPSEETPLTAHHFVKVFEECGLPPGVLNLVHGFGPEAGQALCEHPGTDILAFTGSTEVGRLIAEIGARGYKRVSLEMGGKNPIIVMDDADLDLAVQGCVWGAFGTSGQRCTAASRLIVHKAVYTKFLEGFVERAKALRVGNGLDPQTQMGPIINEAQLRKIEHYVELGKQEGARLMCGGYRLTDGDLKYGYFYAPTVFADVHPSMKIAQDEIFGPVVCVIPFETLDEAIEIANGVRYGLSSAIYTRDVRNAMVAIRDLQAGITYINAPSIGAEIHLPFGGVKQTGNGHREGGTQVLDIFSEWKAVYVDYSGRLQRAQIDTERLVKLGD